MSLNRGCSALGNEQCVKIVENSFNTLLNNNAENVISRMSQYMYIGTFGTKTTDQLLARLLAYCVKFSVEECVQSDRNELNHTPFKLTR